MSLVSNMAAACFELQHVRPYDGVDAVGKYHVVAITENSRISWGGSWIVRPRWHATTPPCFIQLAFHEVWPSGENPSPCFTVLGICNNCNEGVTRLGSSSWFRMAEIRLQNYGSYYTQVKQVHVQIAGTNAGSVGFFVTGFPG